jgi:uncharacterized protein with PIN domain
MVIDSSALIALLLGEPESTDFVTSIAAATTRLTSAPSDCFTCALAKITGEPVLFKGDDFSRTDLVAAAAAL